MLSTREVILFKIQTAVGAEATPDPAADAVLCAPVQYANEGLRMLSRNNVKPTISTDPQVFGGTLKKITIPVELKGSGTAGTAPEIGPMFRCCGMDETISAGTSVAYQPVTLGHEAATIYYHQEGKRYKLLDARGTFTITAEVGQYPTVSFEFTGKDGGEVDDSFPAATYNATVPKPFVKVPFTIDGYGAIINSLVINAGNTVSTPGDSRDDWGFGETKITQRDPNGTVDPIAVTKAVKDFESAFKNGSLLALDTGVVGSVPGNRWQLSGLIGIRDITQGEREQNRTNDLAYGLHETNGDDEYVLTFS